MYNLSISPLTFNIGAYILSPLQEAGRDPSHNYGFIISYRPSKQVVTRVSTYSIKNTLPVNEADPLSSGLAASLHETTAPQYEPKVPSELKPKQKSALSRVLSVIPTGTDVVGVAFKSLPIEYANEAEGCDLPPGLSRRVKTCRDNIDEICALILRTCRETDVGDESILTTKDVVRCAARYGLIHFPTC